MKFTIANNRVSMTVENNTKTVGVIDGRVYTSPRRAREHFHRVHNGWGIDIELLDLLTEKKVDIIHIYDEHFNDHYYSDVQAFRDYGVYEDYGYGKQYILSKLYWGTEPDYLKESKGFVHLHVHSEYSTLDGLGHVEELALKARRMNMNALALTDHGCLFGIYKFHKACKTIGIKPILGSEMYAVDDIEVKDKNRYHLCVFAKNKKGYENLLKLSTISHLEGFYYRPRVDKKMLEKHKEGLVVSSACMSGYPIRKILNGETLEAVEKELLWWKGVFGEDYYVEIMPDKMEEYIKVNPILVTLCKKLGIKMISTCDAHYPDKKDRVVHDALLGIQKKVGQNQSPGFSSDVYWLQSKGEVEEHFEKYHPQISHEDYSQMISNTQALADKIEAFEIEGHYKLPRIKSESVSLETARMLYMNTEKRPEYIERFNFELDVIKKLGFEDYFLLIADIINEAKTKGIQVGAGRGSVAGSLVAYVLGITGVDPIKHGLIFERFLNPARKVMPDIDIDFDASRREEVIDYIKSKWKTAKISTYVGMQGKGAIKDCCRYFGIPYGVAELMSQAFPISQTRNNTIMTVSLDEPDFARFAERYPDMLKVARRLEGRIKTKGIHPAGVIISDDEIFDTVGLRLSNSSTGEPVIQCDMEDVDYLGLLKVDILGSKAQTTLSIAKEMAGLKTLDDIPLDDEEVFDEFCNGNTWDIFQFQSELGHDTVVKVQPRDFESLTAITALVRPGAYDFIDRFAQNDYEPIMDELKPILKDTRNIILYQEQAMKIAVDIAGFSLESADDLRKAIGKKKADAMAKLRREFIKGGVAKGFPSRLIEELFGFIEKSSNYSFNKSHAVAYTLCSYWSMYMKVHFPIEWAVAELTVQVGDEVKLKRYLDDAMNNGIKFLPPDINKSEWGFRKEGDKVRCGLGMVKRFSEKAYAEIAPKRPFADYEDFTKRVSGVKCNKGAVQSLIKAGAFDGMGYPRRFLNDLIERAKLKKKSERESFKVERKEWTEKQLARFEKEALGFNLTGNPLKAYEKDMEKFGIDTASGRTDGNGRQIKVMGIVESIKEWNSKNGEMAFVDLSGYSNYSLNIWHEGWLTYKGHIKKGQAIIVFGRKLEQVGKISLDVNKGDCIKFLDASD